MEDIALQSNVTPHPGHRAYLHVRKVGLCLRYCCEKILFGIWEQAHWFYHAPKEAQYPEVTTLKLLTRREIEITSPHLLLLVKHPRDTERFSLFCQVYFPLNGFFCEY